MKPLLLLFLCGMAVGQDKLCADQLNNPIECKGAGTGYQWLSPEDKPHLVTCHWKTNTMIECDGWVAPMTIETANLPKPDGQPNEHQLYGACLQELERLNKTWPTELKNINVPSITLPNPEPTPPQLPMNVPAIKVSRPDETVIRCGPNPVSCDQERDIGFAYRLGKRFEWTCPDESWELHVSVNGKGHWCSRPPVLDNAAKLDTSENWIWPDSSLESELRLWDRGNSEIIYSCLPDGKCHSHVTVPLIEVPRPPVLEGKP